MKFTAEASALAEATNWAMRGISPRPPVAILSGLHLSVDGQQVTITGFDYETYAQATAAVDALEPGTAVVPGKMLTDILGKMPRGGSVSVEVEGDRMTLRSGKAKYVVALYQEGTYPTIPAFPDYAGTVDGAEFARAAGQARVSVSMEGDKLPAYAHIKIVVTTEELGFYSTDRYRLMESFIPWAPAEPQNATWLLKTKQLESAAKLTSGDLEIFANDTAVAFKSGNRVLWSVLVDLPFPDLSRLFPTSFPTVVTYDRDTLREALGRSVLVTETLTPVTFKITADETELDSGTADKATGREFVESTLAGDPMVIKFQPRYMLDALGTMEPGPVVIHFQADAKKPAVVEPQLDNGDTPSYRHLVMPQVK